MTASNRRIHPRPYFFEWFLLVNLLISLTVLRGHISIDVPGLLEMVLNFCIHAAIGVAIRGAWAWRRGSHRRYFRIVRSIGWLTDTLRLAVSGAVLAFSYGWIKLVVPIFHPRLFDQELWDLDRMLFFGISPNILFLDLFSNRPLLRVVDFSYAVIFFVSFLVILGYFLSEPSRRLRTNYQNANSLMWMVGAWLYMLVPSLGPAYRFPDVYFPYQDALQRTQHFQALLMRNYQNVIRIASGGTGTAPLNFMFGIGAFPSMHVAQQTFAFLWMRKLWQPGEVLYAIFLFTIFLGSMLTGWHYFIDGVAGFLLAWAAYAIFTRRMRFARWLALRK